MMIYQFLGLPAQIPYNDCHDYILRHRKPAKGGNPRWEPIDLGGGDAKLVDTLAKHTTEKDKKSVWESLSRSRNQRRGEKESAAARYFAAQLETASTRVLATHRNTNEVLQWAIQQSHLLIWTHSPEQSLALHRALYPLLEARSQPNVFSIGSAKDLRKFMQELVVKDGKLTFKQPSAHGDIIVNWAGFSPKEMLPYKSLFDKPPKIGDKPFSSTLKITNLMHLSEDPVCDTFTSLFKPRQTLTWPKDNPQYALPSQMAIDDSKAVNPPEKKDTYGGVVWECLLKGKITISDNLFEYVIGELQKAIENNSSGLILLDPPQNSPEFDWYWHCLMTERRFRSNGDYIKLPDNFTLGLAPAPTEPLHQLSIEPPEEVKDEVEATPTPQLKDNALDEFKKEFLSGLDPETAAAIEKAHQKITCFYYYLCKIPHGQPGTPDKPRMSKARYFRAMEALLSGHHSDRSNPIKSIFLYDYTKGSESYNFINVISKILFVDYVAKPKDKDDIRIEKLKKLEQSFKAKGLPSSIWQWRRLNCYSGPKLREIFHIQNDANIHQIMREQIDPRRLPEVAESDATQATFKQALSMRSKARKKDPLAKSIRRGKAVLAREGKVNFKGPPGSGKTHEALRYASEFPEEHRYFGGAAKDACLADAENDSQPILVIDESNTEPMGSLHTIHRIVEKGGQFIGTSNEEVDSSTRHLDPVLQDMETVYFKGWSDQEYLDLLLMPLASKLSWPQPNQQEAMCKALLAAFHIAKMHVPAERLSTRDLQQMLMRLEYRLEIAQKKNKDTPWQAVLMTVIWDEWCGGVIKDKTDFKKALFQYFEGRYDEETKQALSAYVDGYETAETTSPEAIAEYLEKYNKVAFNVPFKRNNPLQRVLAALKAQKYYVLKHRERDIALAVEGVCLHQRKQRLTPEFQPASVGKSGILVKGDSGIGKSKLLRIILSTLGITYEQFNMGESHATIAALVRSRRTKQATIADEIDLADKTVEAPLNHLTTGKDETGKPIPQSDHLTLCSRNGTEYKNRNSLSIALENRFDLMEISNFSRLGLELMLIEAGLDAVSAKECVEKYLAARKENPHQINPRTFFEILANAPIAQFKVRTLRWLLGYILLAIVVGMLGFYIGSTLLYAIYALATSTFNANTVFTATFFLLKHIVMATTLSQVIVSILSLVSGITLSFYAMKYLIKWIESKTMKIEVSRHTEAVGKKSDIDIREASTDVILEIPVEADKDEKKEEASELGQLTTSTCLYGTSHLFDQNKYSPSPDMPGSHTVAIVPGQLQDPSIDTVVLSNHTTVGVLRRMHDARSEQGHQKKLNVHFYNPQVPPQKRSLKEAIENASKIARGAMLIESEDPDFVRDTLLAQIPNCKSFDINLTNSWGTHIEKKSLSKKLSAMEESRFRFHYQWMPIVKALDAGETVVVTGSPSLELERELQSLFDPTDPYLNLNSERVCIRGRLLWVRKPSSENSFSYAPDRTVRVKDLGVSVAPEYLTSFVTWWNKKMPQPHKKQLHGSTVAGTSLVS